MIPSPEDLKLFEELLDKYRYDFCKLVYILFPFGEPGHELEKMKPYDWQMEEWAKMSAHYQNPLTRDQAYRLCVSSGNGAAKTAFGAMTFFMIMYTHQVHARITSNTEKQNQTVVWPEYDVWFRRARFSNFLFEKLGTSIKARNPDLSEKWRLDAVTWSEENPASISGLHNKGTHKAVGYIFEEAAGIPAKVWDYTSGAMTDTDTMKFFLAFANSDDPNSKFEQNMESPDWNSRRIDTRTLFHVSKDQIAIWLREAGGNEDADEFRIRVRGLPRKAVKDAIINGDAVEKAVEMGKTFDPSQVSKLPSLLTVDPAWQGGDDTVIWHHQGPYSRLLARYKLDRNNNEDHMLTFRKLLEYERLLKVDEVRIDAGEGTALKTLANNHGKWNWYLVNFANKPTDQPDSKDSEYANVRAQMYYEANKALTNGEVVITCGTEEEKRDKDLQDVMKQLSWTKGSRHKVTGKKLAEAKKEIKDRVGQSPDLSDGFVMRFSGPMPERLEEHEEMVSVDGHGGYYGGVKTSDVGSRAWERPPDTIDYDEEHHVHY